MRATSSPGDPLAITIPTFGQARREAPPTPASPSGTTPMPEREPGTHPGPGRDLPTPASPTSSPTMMTMGGLLDEAGDGESAGRLGRFTLRPGRERRTSSSAGEAELDVKDLAQAIAGVLAVLTAFAAWLVRRSSAKAWDLREPEEEELEKVAKPLARIGERHVGTALLTPDLVDSIAAASGVAAYVRTDPLYRLTPDPPASPTGPDDDLDRHGYERP